MKKALMFSGILFSSVLLGCRKAPSPKKARTAEPRRAPITSVTQAGIRVDVIAGVIGKVPLLNTMTKRTSKSKEKLLRLTVRVTNLSTTKKMNYRVFRSGLTDDLKNVYKPTGFAHFGLFEDLVGKCERTSIYPEKSVQDILVFEVPVAKAKQLILRFELWELDDGHSIFELTFSTKAVEQ